MTTKVKIPAWDEDRTGQLTDIVDGETQPISQAVVAEAAKALGTTNRSIASKLRNMEYKVESAAAGAKAKSYSDAEEAELRTFVEDNAGKFTYAEIATQVLDGSRTPKQIQGKILSMDLFGSVKKTEKAEVVAKYTDAETNQIIEMVQAGNWLEEIAEAMDRKINSIRGKCLSLLQKEVIDALPKQRDHKEGVSTTDALTALGDEVGEMTVVEIAEAIDKTERGVKTMLTKRGINVQDYQGADRHAKNMKKKAEAELKEAA